MSQLSKRWGMPVFLLVVFVFVLACSLTTSNPVDNQYAFEATKAALQLEGTAMSLQITQAALDAQQNQQQQQQPTQPPIAQPTMPPPPTVVQ